MILPAGWWVNALGNTLTQAFDYYGWNEKSDCGWPAGGPGQASQQPERWRAAKLDLSLRPVGNVKQITNSIASETSSYGYDSIDRLTSWNLNSVIENYAYDPTTGNLVTTGSATLQYAVAGHERSQQRRREQLPV